MKTLFSRVFPIALAFSLTLASVSAQDAQTFPQAPCGVVDSIDYPIDISDTLGEGYDDFALLRPRFGGNHVGIDIGFDRWGEPVRAAARGRVTYSNIFGWDTEKGVVIIEHIFPTGERYYTVYGHMEQGDQIFFPGVGTCVERGEIVGLIGWPSRGLPHLHYEIRNFLPTDGGPGYVQGNPLDQGWFHPLDFTELWRVRLSPGYISALTFDAIPSLPPIMLENGGSVIASGVTLNGFAADDTPLWRVSADSLITGIASLPGDRVVARSRSGQTMTLQGGRYVAVWNVPGPEAPLAVLGETIIIVTEGMGLAGYSPHGEALWSIPGMTETASADASLPLRIAMLETNGTQVGFAVRDSGGVRWQLYDAQGRLSFETTFSTPTPVIVPAHNGGWLALDGGTLYRIHNGERTALASIAPIAGRTARMAADIIGNAYIYLGDSDATLLSIGPMGEIRWRSTYPYPVTSLAPLIDVGAGCLLYSLDADGVLNVFNALTGELVTQSGLYPGGVQNGSPRARLLSVDSNERVLVGGGFLSAITLDGTQLGGVSSQCLLG